MAERLTPNEPANHQDTDRPPNVLWICTDQQRFDTLGCYGNGFVSTPNIDRLAENGILFDHCYAQSPLCVPSRASFLTGRYPRTTRCRQNGQNIPADEVLVTRLLADAGYACGLAGKLHISASDAAAGLLTERRIDDGYVYFHWSHRPFTDWRGDTASPSDEYNSYWLREQGVEYQPSPFRGSEYVQVGIDAKYHQTTWCAEKAIIFIEANETSNRPWLMSVNPFAPHHPFDPPPDYLERYLDRLDEIPLPNYTPGELEDKPPFQRICHDGAYNVPGRFRFDDMSENDHRLIRAAYWAMVDLIDAQVGRLVSALESTGQLDNTMIIFTSDHGEMLGDHGIYLKGPFFYEGAVRVPLVVSWPRGFSGGQRCGELVELADIAPTLLEAAGTPRHPGMQGRSLLPIMTGRPEPARTREDVYCEYYNSSVMFEDPAAHATMVRTDRYKLVAVHGMDAGELYDLQEDPNETHNRWFDPAHQAAKVHMLKRLADRMAWTVDPLPVRAARW